MPGVETRAFDAPDETRTPDKTRVEVVRTGAATAARLAFDPGWKWSECVKPVAGTERCQVHHVGYAVAGRLTVRLPDGREEPIRAGQSYTIPPGHDAWVEGDEPFVGLEVVSAEQFART